MINIKKTSYRLGNNDIVYIKEKFSMIYIDKNTKTVEIPKNSGVKAVKVTFTNQVTKQVFDVPFTDNKSDVYVIPIANYIKYFVNGQYDYTVVNANDKVLSSGIVQYDGFETEENAFNADIDIVQFTPKKSEPTPKRTLTITENGEYDVKKYAVADVNVKSGGVTFGLANVNTRSYGRNTYEGTNRIVYLTFEGDVWANKDLMVGLSRYKGLTYRTDVENKANYLAKSSNKYTLINDQRKHLTTALECYKSDNNVFAYHYPKDGRWYMHRDPKSIDTWCDVSYNKASCVNALIDFVGDAGSDYNMTRYPEGDLDSYVNVNKAFGNSESVYDIVHSGSTTYRPDDLTYTGYFWDSPIVPVKISDLKLRVDGKDTDLTLNNIDKETFDSYKWVEFIYPHNVDYIWNRLNGDRGKCDNSTGGETARYFQSKFDKKYTALVPIIIRRNGLGTNTNLRYTNHLLFNLFTEEQVKCGRPSNFSGVKKTLIEKTNPANSEANTSLI